MTKPAVNDLDRQLGLRLKKARQMVGLTAAGLAEIIGITQQQLSRYENGQNKISAAQLYVIASHLGMPVSWFFLEIENAFIQSVADRSDSDEPMNNHELREPAPPNYIASRRASYLTEFYLLEDTDNLQLLWPRIPHPQRQSLLRLMDSLVENPMLFSIQR